MLPVQELLSQMDSLHQDWTGPFYCPVGNQSECSVCGGNHWDHWHLPGSAGWVQQEHPTLPYLPAHHTNYCSFLLNVHMVLGRRLTCDSFFLMWPKPKTLMEFIPYCVFNCPQSFGCLKWIEEHSFEHSLPLFLALYDPNYDPRCVSTIDQLPLSHLQRLTINLQMFAVKDGMQCASLCASCGVGKERDKQQITCRKMLLFCVLSLRQLLAAGRPVLSHHASQALCQGGPAQPEHVQTLCRDLPFQGQ